MSEKKKQRIEVICKETGWDADKAELALSAASKLGINSLNYVNHECWKMSNSELMDLGEKLKLQKQKKEERIKKLIEITGWDEEKAKKEISAASKLGVNSAQYMKNECWNMDLTAIADLASKLKQEKDAKEAKAKSSNENGTEKELTRKEQRIKQLVETTGWDETKVKAELKAAKELGVSSKQYVENECEKMSNKEIFALGEKLKKQKERKEARIVDIINITGWSEEKVRSELKKASKMGITSAKYVRYECWLLNDDELKELSEVFVKLFAKRERDNEFYIDAVCRLTGWSRARARSEMVAEKEKGVSFMKYIQKNYFGRSEANKQLMTDFLLNDKERINKNKEYYVGKICEKTGWNNAKAKLEVAKARLNCGASFEDYYVFKMYELTPEEQREYVTYGLFSKMRIKYNEYFTAHAIFDDKAAFNSRFAECIDRKWFVNENISYEEFKEKMEGIPAVLAKPLAATQGIGIQKFRLNESEEQNRQAYEDIMALEKSIVEQYIVQHEDVMAFCDTSVNTLRITTLNANGKCNFLYAVFRMGRGAVVDNFHAGGIAATVDVNTGIVSTNAVDLDGNVYEVNPYSGLTIKGFKIPNWDKIVEACEKIYNKVDNVNLIGWDFAITPNGVDLIEGNPGASYVVAQIPMVPEGKGLRDTMIADYLD